MSKARQQANLSSDGNLFADISNDRVGIGSIVPTHKLHVNGTSKFDDDVKFEGTTATKNIIWDKSADVLKISDTIELQFGSSAELKLSNNGTAGYIQHSGSGYLFIHGNDIALRSTSQKNYIVCDSDQEVTLYFNNSPKFETTNTGAKVTGNLEVTGVLTYDDVTSVDSIGIVTARDGVQITADNKYFKMGAGNDISVVHTGAESVIANATGHLTRRSDVHKWENYNASSEYARIDSSGRVLIGATSTRSVNAHAPRLQVSGTDYSTSTVSVVNNAADATGAYLFFTKQRSGSAGGSTAVAQDDIIGDIRFTAGDGTDVETGAARITVVAESNAGSNSVPSYMRFSTTSTTTPVERLRITSGGSVNIGTNNLNQTTFKSQIETGTNKFISFGNAAHNDLSNEGSGIIFSRPSDGAKSLSGIFQHTTQSLGMASRADLTFHAGGTSTYSAAPERLRITSGGKIGINETSPDALLHLSNIGSAGITAGIRLESLGTNNNAGDTMGQIEFAHSDSNDAGVSASIKCVAEDTAGNTYLTFNNGNPGSVDERLRIASDGEVGIGTVNPNALLDVFSNTAATDKDLFMVRSATGAFAVQCSNVSAANPEWRLRTYSSEPIVFSPGNVERLRITSAGNVNQTIAADAIGFNQTAAGNHYIKNIVNANRTGANASILALHAHWNSKDVAAIKFRTGADTSNKDDGHICFETSSANNITERLRINSSGHMILSPAGYSLPTADERMLNIVAWGSKPASIGFQRSNSLGGTTSGWSNELQSNGDLLWGVHNVGEKLRIKYDGDVNAATGHLQAQDIKIGLAADRYPIIQRAVQSSGSQNLSITGGSGYSEHTGSDHSLVDAREGALIQLGAGDPTSDTYGGYIKYFAHGHTSPNSSGVGNQHVFYTRSGVDTNTERLRIKSDGNIGMGGNTNPTSVLHIKTSVNNTAVATIESTATDSYPFLRLKNDAREYQLTCHGPLADVFTIYDGTAGAHRLTITSAGVIGVNNTTPDGKGIDVTHGRTNGYGATSDHRSLAHIIARNSSDAPGRFASISLVSGGGTQAEGSINLVQTGNYTGDLAIKLRSTATRWTERLRINVTGEYSGTVDVKGLPSHLRLYTLRDTADWDSGDPIGKLDYYVGDDTTNNLPYTAAYIHCLNDVDNANEPSGALSFGTATANLSGGAIEKLRIKPGGQLVQYTNHLTGTSDHQYTGWYGDDANHYYLEYRDFNELYAKKTYASNGYGSIIYRRETMTSWCDIEFDFSGNAPSGTTWRHLGFIINGDGSDTTANMDRLVYRVHNSTSSSNKWRLDKGGGGEGFGHQGSDVMDIFDGTRRHIHLQFRGRQVALTIDGVSQFRSRSDADFNASKGFFGFCIYEYQGDPYVTISNFKIKNYTEKWAMPTIHPAHDSDAAVVKYSGKKWGRMEGKRIHTGSDTDSTAVNILTIDQWQSTNSRIIVKVEVMGVSPVSEIAFFAFGSGYCRRGGSNTTSQSHVVNSMEMQQRFGNNSSYGSISWNGSTLRYNVPSVAYIDLHVNAEWHAYDGAEVSFDTDYRSV